jgi:hypothetical protein
LAVLQKWRACLKQPERLSWTTRSLKWRGGWKSSWRRSRPGLRKIGSPSWR